MSGYRCDIQARIEGARRGLVGGGAAALITVRLLDDPASLDAQGRPAACEPVATNLAAPEARALAFELLCLAEHAERITKENTR